MNEVIKVEDCGPNIGDYDIPIHNAIIIPNNATNGSVIEELFPNLNFTNVLAKMYAQNGKILLDWWNAPYKAESAE